MTQITIDDATLARIQGLSGPAEILDERGNLLGHYTPAEKPAPVMLPSDRCPYTPDELKRMRNAKGGRPLKDILRDLGAE